EAGSNITLTETGNTITIAATGGGGLSGSGTTNTIPKFTASTTLGNSLFTDDGSVTAAGGTAAFRLPNGTTGERPSTALNGQIRYNTTNSALEYFDGAWEVPLLTDNATTGLETAGRVLIAKASGKAGSNAALTFNETDRRLVISNASQTFASSAKFGIVEDGAGLDALMVSYNSIGGASPSANAAAFQFHRARGSFASPQAVITDDRLGAFLFGGHDGTSIQNGAFFGALCDGTPTAGSVPTRFAIAVGTSGSNRPERLTIKSSGNVGIGTTTPTAALHLKAGTATANSAPLKFTSGTNLTTAEAGAMEYNGTNLLFTPSTVRHTVNHGLTGSATLDFPTTNAQSSSDLTITVTGASDGDVVSLGVPNAAVTANSCYTAWVSASNTVTIRFNNYSTGAANPASATFKVFITK
ncbi:MAG: hypothetical protein ACR2K1_15075, partial [Saprospiraceae bacterium]